jgi:hypothetical protein
MDAAHIAGRAMHLRSVGLMMLNTTLMKGICGYTLKSFACGYLILYSRMIVDGYSQQAVGFGYRRRAPTRGAWPLGVKERVECQP